jgi:hypothetical protein
MRAAYSSKIPANTAGVAPPTTANGWQQEAVWKCAAALLCPADLDGLVAGAADRV